MIIRPFRELPDYNHFQRVGEQDIEWIQEHSVAQYELDTPDVSASRYWQVSGPDSSQKLRALFEVVPKGHLAGLSLNNYSSIDSGFNLILEYAHLLPNVHSLAIAGEQKPDLKALLQALPDLRNLQLRHTIQSDFSLVRHANLSWLSVERVTGLDAASFPSLAGFELRYASIDKMDELHHVELPQLSHFGISKLIYDSLKDIFSHQAFPKHISSLYVDGDTLEDGPLTYYEDLLSCPARKQLKKLSMSDVFSFKRPIVTDTCFPSLEHLAMHDCPGYECAANADDRVSFLFDAALPKGITSLDLHGVEFSDDVAQMILQQPFIQRLNYLNLTGNKMEDAALQAEFKALRANGCTVVGLE